VRVWTDYYGARLLPTYSHNTFGGRAWKAAAVLSVYDKKAEPFRPGDLVVFIDRGCPPCTQYLDAFRANRPAQIATWDVVHRSSDGGFTVYRVT
jgi:hypothetical protein